MAGPGGINCTRCWFSENVASPHHGPSEGGAVFIYPMMGSAAASGFTVSFTDVVFHSNAAPHALGGAVIIQAQPGEWLAQMATGGVTVEFTRVQFLNNSAHGGGAVAVAELAGFYTFTDCTFVGNQATSGSGGAFIATGVPDVPRNMGSLWCVEGKDPEYRRWHPAAVYTFDHVSMVNNSALCGDPGPPRATALSPYCTGGGVSVSNGTVLFTDSVLQGNTAQLHGGAIHLERGSASLTLNRTSVAGNWAAMGRQVYVDSAGSVTFDNSSLAMSNPDAAAGTGILAPELHISDGGGGVAFQGGTEFTCPAGSSLVQPNYLPPYLTSAPWWPASCLFLVAGVEVACEACNPGTYTMQHGRAVDGLSRPFTCHACPYGGDCREGGDVVRAMPGFWASPNSSSAIAFAPCPDNYCCPASAGDASCGSPSFCDGNRTGVLCGECLPGFSEPLGSSTCQPAHECDDAVWFTPLALLVGLMFAYYMVWGSGRMGGSGLAAVTVYYYQLVPLVGPQTQPLTVAEAVVDSVVGLFSLRLPSGHGSLNACLFTSFTAVDKMAFRFGVPVVVALLILLFYSCKGCLERRRLARRAARARMGARGGGGSAGKFGSFGGSAATGDDSLRSGVTRSDWSDSALAPATPDAAASETPLLPAAARGGARDSSLSLNSDESGNQDESLRELEAARERAAVRFLLDSASEEEDDDDDEGDDAGRDTGVAGSASAAVLQMGGGDHLRAAVARSASENVVGASAARRVSGARGDSGATSAEASGDEQREALALQLAKANDDVRRLKQRLRHRSVESGSSRRLSARRERSFLTDHSGNRSVQRSEVARQASIRFVMSRSRFVVASVVFGLFSYSQLTHDAFQLLHCVRVPGVDGLRLFRAAESECYTAEAWWQYVLLVVVFVLSLVPIVMAFGLRGQLLATLRRVRRETAHVPVADSLTLLRGSASTGGNTDDSLGVVVPAAMGPVTGTGAAARIGPPIAGARVRADARQLVLLVLKEPYQQVAWHWEAVMMLLRLALIMNATFVTRYAVLRELLAVLVLVAHLAHHCLMQPFRASFVNTYQTALLGFLTVLAAMQLPSAAVATAARPAPVLAAKGSVFDRTYSQVFTVVKTVLLVTPVTVLAIERAWNRCGGWCTRRVQGLRKAGVGAYRGEGGK